MGKVGDREHCTRLLITLGLLPRCGVTMAEAGRAGGHTPWLASRPGTEAAQRPWAFWLRQKGTSIRLLPLVNPRGRQYHRHTARSAVRAVLVLLRDQ